MPAYEGSIGPPHGACVVQLVALALDDTAANYIDA